MSGRISVSRIPMMSQLQLPGPARAALIEAKRRLRQGGSFDPFRNEDDTHGGGPPLPGLSHGCDYVETDAGEARPEDPVSRRGARRFVFEFHGSSKEIRNIYYSDAHYLKDSFVRIV